jgi:hypothetical protein
MDMENSVRNMALNTKDIGKMTCFMAKEYFRIKMVFILKESFSKVREMGLEKSISLINFFIQAIGRMI